MAFFSLRFIFFAEKFAEERGYQENTAIVIRLLGAFMASYLITAIVILLGDKGLEGTIYYFLALRISFVLIFLLMVGQYLKLPKDYGIKPSPQPVIASALGIILIQIILYNN